MILLPMVASADAVEIDGIYYNLIEKAEQAEVTQNPNKYTGEVVIPESVTYEGKNYSVTSIGYRAFLDCSGMTSVTIPNSVTSIGDGAFGNCSSLTSIIIPNSVTRIGSSAFSGCVSLTSLVISNSVTSIYEATFVGCRTLTTVTIPNSVTDIKTYAFKDCSGLTSLIIGSDLSEIRRHAFYDCRNISNVYCHAEKVPNLDYEALENANIRSATLHVPESLVEVYKDLDGWKNFASIVALTDSDPGMQKCATPTISIVDGKLKFSSETEDVTFKTYCTYDSSSSVLNSDELVLGGTTICHVNVYATKVGYKDSDNATTDIEINVGKLGDVDADGVVDIADAVRIVNFVVGKIDALAPHTDTIITEPE